MPKDVLCGQLATGERPTGRPRLRFCDVVKRDMKAIQINVDSWELRAGKGPHQVAHHTTSNLSACCWSRRALCCRHRKKSPTPPPTCPNFSFVCTRCARVCKSRIGLHSHQRHCSTQKVFISFTAPSHYF